MSEAGDRYIAAIDAALGPGCGPEEMARRRAAARAHLEAAVRVKADGTVVYRLPIDHREQVVATVMADAAPRDLNQQFALEEDVLATLWQKRKAARKAQMKPPAPPRVKDVQEFWGEEPDERSARCAWWVERIKKGWRPGKRVRVMNYYSSAEFYGVWIWEYLNVLYPLLKELGAE